MKSLIVKRTSATLIIKVDVFVLKKDAGLNFGEHKIKESISNIIQKDKIGDEVFRVHTDLQMLIAISILSMRI